MEKITDRLDFVNNHSHESLFIEAGAGAGKSTTMVAKIVHNILSGVAPERIVAITFTNKSAEDLLIRVSEEVDKARKNKTGEDKKKLDNAFYSLYKMKISTIHSFCYKVLSEYSFAAEIPYGVELIEEDDLKKITDNAFKLWQKAISPSDWHLINDIGNAIDGDVFYIVKNLYDYLCTKWMDDMELVVAERFDIAPYYQRLKDLYLFVSQYEGTKIEFSSSLKDAYENSLIPFFEDQYNECVDDNSPEIFDFYKALIKTYGAVCKKTNKFKKNKDVDDIDSINEELLTIIEDLIDKTPYLKTYFNGMIDSLAKEAYGYYLYTKENDYITNNELIYFTYSLIKDNQEARKQIADQYDVIYVDEFQDTDRYQIEIVKLLALEIDKRKKDVNVGSLVVVGDPKQSIYRFRGADFQSYMGFKDLFPKLNDDYKVVCLPDNFRSSSIILDWVNDTYSKMNFYDGYTYEPMLYPDNHKLIDYSDNSKALAGVYLHKLHEKYDYSITAELVDYLVKNHYQIMVPFNPRDKNTKYMWRDIRYSDFMIIFAAKTHLNECAKAFAKRGIPYDITGQLEVSAYEGIREIVRLLAYLLIPNENNKKTAMETLSHHLKNKEEIDSTLADLFTQTKEMTNYGKLYYLFNNYDQYISSLNEIDTKGIQSSIFQILENIYSQDEMPAVNLINALYEIITNSQDTALSVNRENNAVRIMNAHQTKGLEANIVIYITAQEKNNIGQNEVVDGKIYLNCLDQYPSIKELCAKQNEEEGLRKEYVVSTRARQVMIFDDELAKEKLTGSRLYHIADYPYDWNNLDKYQINKLPEDISTSITENNLPFTKVKKGKIEEINIPEYVELTPSQLEARRYNPDIEKEKIINDVHRPKDNLFGTILHRCNELYVRNPNRDLKEIVDIAMKENECDSGYYKKYLLKCAYATKELFVGQDLLKNKLEPEFKFYYERTDKVIPILINGSIDLLVIGENKITIIDFKSDSADYQNKEQFEQVLKDNYHHQLDEYKEFIKSIYPDYQIDTEIIWYEEIDDRVTAQILKID